uniref:Uncharacterized protein n=1 Tax=Clandestinovirus TaxID=2831644 RepID=A0A8F8KPH0_9VIRU|nr:hypothetical protein KOM_12_130 [Clandestinovirus]
MNVEQSINEIINNCRCKEPKRTQRVNQHGADICYVIGCMKHKRVVYEFGGCFCTQHINVIRAIRHNIKESTNYNDEWYWRSREIYIRKDVDMGHVKRVSVCLYMKDKGEL